MQPISPYDFREAVREAASGIAVERQSRAVQTDPPPDGPDGPDGPPQPTWPGWPDPHGQAHRRRYDGWNGRAGCYPALRNGRAGYLTPAQHHRARHAERV
ncbi:hypothetical protein [Plantactinospora sp. KLBMP9567]|uniref:hypothetical protein n=1 Tax=Plantactinospora sp. KLBMP9567 TaxID=3085900 RepID=UPI002980F2A7|nr:hypothetical protein [Plantactinospora sp. KLBMP9567]MDW5330128.1 hypothetical protein [Plantactinospora sp. KLBMP9567]